jgi:ferredoxin
MGSNQKRDTLFHALDHLIAASDAPPAVLPLPAGAPLGDVEVDRAACTLCMACVSVCPASALSDGRDRPLLGFLERNCVQCGLCQRACPESAIRITPRLLIDRAARNAVRTLNEEAPFNCVACGKPFATRSVIDRMTDKLATHSMFRDPAALRRLQMCGDCRVIDMMKEGTPGGDA